MRVLQGRYRIDAPLGHGGMGDVFRGEDVRLGRPVALKRIPGVNDFLREARVLGGLDHPNIVRVLDAFEDDTFVWPSASGRALCGGNGQSPIPTSGWLVMELVPGRDLQSVLDAGVPPLERALRWLDQIAEALEYLHAQVPPVHFRDLKPANVVLDDRGEVRLVDFGISRRAPVGSDTETALRGCGTPGYAPLEQYGGGTTAASDQYALGATAFALLTGGPPPPAPERAVQAVPLSLGSVPHALQVAVLRMLSLRPADRFASVAEARAALRGRVGTAWAAQPAAPPPRVVARWTPASMVSMPIPALETAALTVLFQGLREPAEQVAEAFRSAGFPAALVFARDVATAWPGYWAVVLGRRP